MYNRLLEPPPPKKKGYDEIKNKTFTSYASHITHIFAKLRKGLLVSSCLSASPSFRMEHLAPTGRI